MSAVYLITSCARNLLVAWWNGKISMFNLGLGHRFLDLNHEKVDGKKKTSSWMWWLSIKLQNSHLWVSYLICHVLGMRSRCSLVLSKSLKYVEYLCPPSLSLVFINFGDKSMFRIYIGWMLEQQKMLSISASFGAGKSSLYKKHKPLTIFHLVWPYLSPKLNI